MSPEVGLLDRSDITRPIRQHVKQGPTAATLVLDPAKDADAALRARAALQLHNNVVRTRLAQRGQRLVVCGLGGFALLVSLDYRLA